MSNAEEDDYINSNKKRKGDDDDNTVDDYRDATDSSMLIATDVRGRPPGMFLDDLNWRIEKLRLEEKNKRRFLKSRPRFLPYDEARKWAQAWGQWESSEEWNDWIALGEKRTSYIPSQPEEYYTRTGQWISWEDFLGVKKKDNDVKSN